MGYSYAKVDDDADFKNMKVTYNEHLMPVENASGSGTLDLAAQTLDIKGDHATVGDLTGSDVAIHVTNLMTPADGISGPLKPK